MGFWDVKTEMFVRLSSIIGLLLTVLLLAFDKETTQIFHIHKNATFRSLPPFIVVIYVDSLAAGYNILQLCKCLISAKPKGPSKFEGDFGIYLFWGSFLLDQAAAYVVFAVNTAALQAALLAVSGAEELQWMKLCNRFNRFCQQVGGAFICGYVGLVAMVALSIISAFHLFTHYSPKPLSSTTQIQQ